MRFEVRAGQPVLALTNESRCAADAGHGNTVQVSPSITRTDWQR